MHAKEVDQNSWDSKYIFLSLSVSRAKQRQAFDFLMSQVDAPFNFRGYLWNAFLPGGFGVGHYHPELAREKHAWYCTQLVGVALQAMGDEDDLSIPYTPPRAAGAMRALSALLVLTMAALAGTLTGFVLRSQAGLTALYSVLIGALAALAFAMVGGIAASSMEEWSAGRAAFYRELEARHDAARASWRSVVGSHTSWHQSSPNSLYDMLLDCRGVTPGRDPHGPRLTLDA